jgi:signal transduction histidine kinase
MTSVADHIGLVVESAQLRQRAEQAAVVEERARLARDLHDSVIQLLYSLGLFTETGYEALQQNNLTVLEKCFLELKNISTQAIKEMRLLVFELRPLMLSEQNGLIGALQYRLEAVEGRIGLNNHLHYNEEATTLPDALEENLYQIAREALNNILKHASASQVIIDLVVQDGQVTLSIRDDGVGFEPECASKRGGFGLISMKQRADKAGGALEIRSALGKGSQVEVKIDL